MVVYDLASVELPRLTGRGLKAFAGALQNPASRAALSVKLLADAGITRFRRESISSAPMMNPLVHLPVRDGKALEPSALQLPEPPKAAHLETIARIAQAYKEERSDPVKVIERYLDALAQDEAASQPLRSMVAVQKDNVRAQAKESAERLRQGKARSVLEGVPIAVKDEVHQAPYPTTVGTRFLGREAQREDATLVARLRAAGAVLIGKANMNEIGINPNGGNMNHGFVRNPCALDHDPGGSSSGSAAVVAAGLCPASIGADGGGSIRIPAALCGVVGLKATYGRISERGVFELCWSVGHVGPIGLTTADVALVYGAIAGADPHDQPSRHQPDVQLEGWDSEGVKGLKIGVYTPWFEHAQPEVVQACQRSLKQLEAAGAEVHQIEIDALDTMRVAHAITILTEMLTAMEEHREHIRELSPTTRVNLAFARMLSARDYVHAQKARGKAAADFARVFEQVDVIATPATAMTAPKIPVTASHDGWSDLSSVTEVMRYVFPGNLVGLPAISFPVGYDSAGLPIGMQLMGRMFEEHTLLRAAHVGEQAAERRPPQVLYKLLD